MHLHVQLLIILALTVINGFFSGAEISLLSVRRTRLQELADSGKRAARVALKLRSDPEQLLATVQVGITFVSASASAFGGATLAQPIAHWLAGTPVGRFAEQLALAVVVTLVSVLSIVLGELVPKSLALRFSERVSLRVARPLYTLARIARPLVWLLTTLSNLVLKPFRDQTKFSESRLSPEELTSLVEEASTTGSLPAGIGDITTRALELGELPIMSLLIPRRAVVAMPLEATREQAWAILKQQPHARYPVIEKNLDALAGYVTARELVAQIIDRGQVDVRAIIREIPAFAEHTPAVEVLRSLQKQRAQLAMVIDDHGMLSGIVTINDIAEELLGDILDERERPIERIRGEGPGVAVARADTPIQDLNRKLGIDLPVSAEYATLSGLLMESSSRIMKVGEQLELGSVKFEVLDATPRQVKLVRLRYREQSDAPPES